MPRSLLRQLAIIETVVCKRDRMIDKEQKYYNRILSKLIGRSIVDVFYEELDYQNKLEYWEFSKDIHSVDMNIIFRLDNNDLIQIKWDAEFYSYGVGFENLSQIEDKDLTKIISIKENNNWKKVLNEKITDLIIYWDNCTENNSNQGKNNSEKNFIQIPSIWEIEFQEQKIWISTFEIKEESDNIFWADHLTIFFNDKNELKNELVGSASTQQRFIANKRHR